MTQTKMAHPMDDIAKQARQGSVAAIIQVLNEDLADSGVRTRAMLVDGVLQLLCEAATVEQLEQSPLIARIRKILEAIAPRSIRRVNINSRIVREQQLLWLEEISRDPENQLLWSEKIVLKKPNLFKRIAEDRKNSYIPKNKPPLPKAASSFREKRQFWRGILGGTGVSLLLLLGGWGLKDWLSSKLINVQTSQPSTTPEASQTAVSSTPSADTFAEAVRLAEQTSIAGKTAQSPAQWLDIAAKWRRASDLMAVVQPKDDRYKTAQNRMRLYRQYSDTALEKSQRKRP